MKLWGKWKTLNPGLLDALVSFPWQFFSLFNSFIEVDHRRGQVHECQEWRLMEVRV